VVQELNALLEEFNVTPTDALKNQIITLLKTNYPQEFLSTVFLKLTGGTVDGDLHVKGDLTVDGIGEEIISTELKVGADTITLRNGNPTAMSATELAGVITENYDGNGNNNILAIDSSGIARVGDIDIDTRLLYSNDGTNFFEDEALTVPATIGQDETVRDTGNTTSGGVEIYEGTTFSNDNTEAIATRENTPANGGVARWNGTAKRFDAVVPDATPTAGSQNLATSGGIFAAMQSSFPVGAVIPFAGASAPQGFLLCDGHSYAPTDPLYANLFAVIGTTYGGDGVSTFNVPDLRETVPVGVGSSNRAALQHDTYTLGQFKDDQFQEHAHNVYVKDTGHTHALNYPTNYVFSAFGQIGAYTPVASGNQLLTLSVVSDNAKIKVNSSPYYKGTDNSTSNAGTTGGTHGKRLGMNYIIKY
jgi:microcystin-dependent protein